MFENLVGNEKAKKSLTQSIKSKNIPHSYIFSGPEGVGKRLFALDYAKTIMCNENGKCNNECDSCIKFNGNSNPDYMQIEPDGKVIKIDQIRKVQERIAEKPIVSSKKVYVINNADSMTEESQNCLLKTLEECPKYAIIILVVSNESRLLATIKSRCVIVKFTRISDQKLRKHFTNLSDEQIKLLDGSFLYVNSIEKKQEEYNNILKIVDILQNGTLLELIEESEMLYTEKDSIFEILNYLNIVLLQRKITEPVIIVEKTKRKISSNNNYEMCIDYLLMNSWKSIRTNNSKV